MFNIGIGTGMKTAKPGQEQQGTGAREKHVHEKHRTGVLVAPPAAIFVRALAERTKEDNRLDAMESLQKAFAAVATSSQVQNGNPRAVAVCLGSSHRRHISVGASASTWPNGS